MWQQCPQCKGSGRNYNGLSSDSRTVVCDVCNGHKIINELTGLPPQTTRPVQDFGEAVRKLKNQNTDFRDANMESQQEYFGK